MLKDSDSETKSTVGSSIGLILSVFVAGSGGFWAYTLDPAGTGGSILILPAVIIVGLVTVAFMGMGIIARNEAYGGSFMIGSIMIPVLFFAASYMFRSWFGS